MATILTERGSIMSSKYNLLSIVTNGTFSSTVWKDKCQYIGVEEAERLSFFNNKDPNDLCHIVIFIETRCLVLEILGISLFKYLQILVKLDTLLYN